MSPLPPLPPNAIPLPLAVPGYFSASDFLNFMLSPWLINYSLLGKSTSLLNS